MKYLEPLFEVPDEIRKTIYTSNAIESVNSALRKVTNGKGSFASVNSVYKILFLKVEEKWKKLFPTGIKLKFNFLKFIKNALLSISTYKKLVPFFQKY